MILKNLYRLIIFLFTIACTEDNENIVYDPIIIEADHFSFIIYDDVSQIIVEPIQNILEENYSKVLGDLDVGSMNQVLVKIWNNESNFLDNMQSTLGVCYPGASGWVAGAYDIRILYQGSSSAQDVLHEFCHCVSLVVNPQIGNNPRWLWEAVAIYESNEFVDPQNLNYLVEGDFPTLEELNSDFNTGNNNIYQVGFLLAEYIIVNWGKVKFIDLIKANGNISQVLEISPNDFEVGWSEYVITKYL